MSLTNLSSLHPHYTSLTNTQIPKLNQSISSIKCQSSTTHPKQESLKIPTRRDVLIQIGGGLLLYNHTLSPPAPPIPQQFHNQSFPQTPSLQLLDKTTITTLVTRPKEALTKNPRMVEILVVDGIEIHHDRAVVFDVYIAKAKANESVIGSELGVFVGSLVNMPFARVGGVEVKSKGCLEFGVSGLMIDIEALGCEMVAVSLVPCLGPVVIGELRIDAR